MTDLPSGWAEATMDDLFLTVLGGDWGKAADDNLDDSCLVRCIRASELRNWADVHGKSAAIRRLKNSSLEKRRLQEGDILVEVSGGGPDQPVGRTVLITRSVLRKDPELDYVCTNFFRFCRPSKEIQAKYLNWYLTYFYRSGGTEELQGGSNNLRNLRFPDFVSQLVPIPPINEQRRIVEKIEAMFDEIDKGVESLQTARTSLGLYRQSLLKSAFEGRLTADWRAQNADQLEAPETLLDRIQRERDTRYKTALDEWQDALAQWRASGEKGKKPAKPKRLVKIKPQHIPESICPSFPNDWKTTRFGNLNLSVSDGPFGSNLKTSDYTESGVRVIRLENIGHGEFLEEKWSFISEEKYETIKRHSVYPGTIMVSSFVTDAVRSCLVPQSIPLAINKADCFAAVLTGEQTIPEFTAFYLQSPQVFDQLDDLVHGVGRPRINTTQLKELHFPICSPAEQAEIIRRLDDRLEAADAMEAEINAALTRADALRQSILKKAFSGKLLPQDPEDEPAAALLARIKSERANSSKKPRQHRMAKQMEHQNAT